MAENSYISAARIGKNDLWRYLLSIGVLILTFLIVPIAESALILLALIVAKGSVDVQQEINQLPPVVNLVIAAIPFLAILIVLWLCLRFIHKRPFRTLLTSRTTLSWRRLLLSASLWFGLNLLGDLFLALVVTRGNYQFQFNLASFAPYALVAILLIPIQSATEELFFRGYLMQGIGLAIHNIWLPLLVTSLLFGSLHSFNPEVAAYGLPVMMVFYVGFGLLSGWVALRTGGLEGSIGLHVTNNLYGTLLVTMPNSSLPSPAVYMIQHYDAALGTVVFLVTAVLYVLLFSLLDRPPDLDSTLQ